MGGEDICGVHNSTMYRVCMAARPQLWRDPPQLVGVAVRDGEAVHDRKDPNTPTCAALDHLVQDLAARQTLQSPSASSAAPLKPCIGHGCPGKLLPVHPFAST